MRIFLHSRTLWLGLFYVLFPLGFLLYGVNDIVDAEADRLNPRKGTFCLGRWACGTTCGVAMENRGRTDSLLDYFLFSDWTPHPGLVRRALDCCGDL